MKIKPVTKENAKPRRPTNASCFSSTVKFEKPKEETTKPGHLDDKVAVNTKPKNTESPKEQAI